jgi:hypothetical protein
MATQLDDTYSRIGERACLAQIYDVALTDPANADTLTAWFETVTDAGRWIETVAGLTNDSEIIECVWREVVDTDSDDVTYHAERHATGRYLDRLVDNIDNKPFARWSDGVVDDEHPDTLGDVDLILIADDTSWELRHNHLSHAVTTDVSHATAHRDLVASLRTVWQHCEAHGGGTNLPEMLRSALEVVASELGSTHHLVTHRPGSWEADHIRDLAASADWQQARPSLHPTAGNATDLGWSL